MECSFGISPNVAEASLLDSNWHSSPEAALSLGALSTWRSCSTLFLVIMPELPAAGLLLGRKKSMFGYTDMWCFTKVVGVDDVLQWHKKKVDKL